MMKAAIVAVASDSLRSMSFSSQVLSLGGVLDIFRCSARRHLAIRLWRRRLARSLPHAMKAARLNKNSCWRSRVPAGVGKTSTRKTVQLAAHEALDLALGPHQRLF